MLGKAAERFIRTKWKSVQQLAEELYAVFSPEMAINPSSVTIEQPSDQTGPLLRLKPSPSNDGPSIVVEHGGVTTNFNSGSDNGPADLPIDLGKVDLGDGGSPATNSAPSPAYNPVVMYGEVSSKVSGVQYNVTVWAMNPQTAPAYGIIKARAPGIDTDDTLPAGYPCLVLLFFGQASAIDPITVQDAVIFPSTFAAVT